MTRKRKEVWRVIQLSEDPCYCSISRGGASFLFNKIVEDSKHYHLYLDNTPVGALIKDYCRIEGLSKCKCGSYEVLE